MYRLFFHGVIAATAKTMSTSLTKTKTRSIKTTAKLILKRVLLF